jgi:hypothetical protein
MEDSHGACEVPVVVKVYGYVMGQLLTVEMCRAAWLTKRDGGDFDAPRRRREYSATVRQWLHNLRCQCEVWPRTWPQAAAS